MAYMSPNLFGGSGFYGNNNNNNNNNENPQRYILDRQQSKHRQLNKLGKLMYSRNLEHSSRTSNNNNNSNENNNFGSISATTTTASTTRSPSSSFGQYSTGTDSTPLLTPPPQHQQQYQQQSHQYQQQQHHQQQPYHYYSTTTTQNNYDNNNEQPQGPMLRRNNSVPSVLECSARNNGNKNNNTFGPRSNSISSSLSNNNTIRFQVIIWNIGQIDLVQGRVPMTFRITIFWNAPPTDDDDVDNNYSYNNNGGISIDDEVGNNNNINNYNNAMNDNLSVTGSSKTLISKWKMIGRQQAVLTESNDIAIQKTVDVPAVSILNVETFTVIGEPEITMLQEDSRLMRWSCMYRAILFEENWIVQNFPHDEHTLHLKLAILAHRQKDQLWDKSIWKLGLASSNDNQGAVKIPYGMIVDHVTIPEFSYNKQEGITFHFVPLADHGCSLTPSSSTTNHNDNNNNTEQSQQRQQQQETCLLIKLKVIRNSDYYDRNIMPLLGMLNLVAVSIKVLEPSRFFERGLLTMNIAFVEIGMRMTVDAKLPSSRYQIKMQRILNQYFFCLLLIVLESLLVYVLHDNGYNQQVTTYIDCIAATLVLSHNITTLIYYYLDAARLHKKILQK